MSSLTYRRQKRAKVSFYHEAAAPFFSEGNARHTMTCIITSYEQHQVHSINSIIHFIMTHAIESLNFPSINLRDRESLSGKSNYIPGTRLKLSSSNLLWSASVFLFAFSCFMSQSHVYAVDVAVRTYFIVVVIVVRPSSSSLKCVIVDIVLLVLNRQPSL